MASPTVAPDVVRPPAGGPAPPGGPAAQVRIEVAMPRGLFDRLTGHDDAPRCRYDEHTGLAEFVAVPDFAHVRTVIDIKLPTAPMRSPFSTVSRAWHTAR